MALELIGCIFTHVIQLKGLYQNYTSSTEPCTKHTALTTREMMGRNDYHSITRKPTQITDALDVRSIMAVLHDKLSRLIWLMCPIRTSPSRSMKWPGHTDFCHIFFLSYPPALTEMRREISDRLFSAVYWKQIVVPCWILN